ncbi:MAG: DUF2066 domain-containing protein [Gammaproteobacteria bacterium]|nr:DUF2066 domain-containing protein [Gammaproteobacteria bacterium]MDH3767528.1 DUF2066 domain-containing protein [Gammaproteobacteria bacterium]
MITLYRPQILAVLCFGLHSLAGAATVPDLYAAAVPVSDRSEEVRQQAFKNCLAAVLVKVTGDRAVASDPDVVDLLESAPGLLQQYRYTADKTLWAAFDGEAVERMARAAGLPVWGSNRPAILMWFAVDWGSGSRGLITADEETDLRRSIERIAGSRGLAIVWPLFDSTDRAAMSFSDLWGGFTEKIEAASVRYDVSGVLVGRASRGSSSRLQVRWKLDMGELTDEWRGGLSDGIHQVADRLGQRFAVSDLGTSSGTTLAVTGISSLGDYARVSDYLESLSLVRHLGIQRIAGDTVVFDLQLQGDPSRLPRIIDLNDTLRRLATEETPSIALSAEQRYRYNP